jgi:hypothetical protein
LNRDDNAIIDYALEVWASGQGDGAFIRHELWFPATAAGLSTGGVVNDDNGWDDLQDECDVALRVAIDKCLGDMSPAMRSVVERSIAFCAVVRCRPQDAAWMLTEGRARVLRAALSAGVPR